MIQRYLPYALLILFIAPLSLLAKRSYEKYTADQLFEFMLDYPPPSNGANQANGTQIPSDFWELPAKQAALELAELNRNDDNIERYALTYHESLGTPPIAPVALSLDNQASGCYSRTTSHYFLRCEPGSSYLIYGRNSTPGGAVFHDIVQSETSYKLLWIPLKDAQARHIANTIWYLDQIESVRKKNRSSSSYSHLMSTADGDGQLLWRSDSGAELLMHGTLWGNYTSTAERLGNNRFKGETVLNIANYLFHQLQTKHTPTLTGKDAVAPILERYSPEHQLISEPIIAIAARLAGESDLQATRTPLKAILEKNIDSKYRAQFQIALLQLEVAQQPELLEQWAIDGTEGARWALQQLQKEHPAHYATALENRLRDETGRAASNILNALDRHSPERAQTAALEVIQRNDDALFTLAFNILQDAETFPDEATHLERLLLIAYSEATDWRVRNAAINCLVPRNNPMRYSDPRIDVVLTNLTASDFSAEHLEYSKLIIARAQLARQPKAHFTRLLRNVSNSLTVSTQSVKADTPYYRIRLLTELSDISENLGTGYKEECEAVLRKELKKGELKADDLLQIALDHNMRSVQPILSNYANRSSDSRVKRLAKKMLALWTESDALTRTKLWITYGYLYIYPSNCDYEGSKFKIFHNTLQTTSKQLSQTERQRLAPFIDQIGQIWLQQMQNPKLQTRKTELIQSIIDGEPLDNYVGKCRLSLNSVSNIRN